MTGWDERAQEQVPESPVVTRRQFLPRLSAIAMGGFAPLMLAGRLARAQRKSSPPAARFVYAGTYTSPGVAPGGTRPSTASGIYVFRMEPADGGLTLLQTVPASNPSFLALDPALTHLYAVNEDEAGHVSAYAVDQANGRLTLINAASTNGRHPAHLSVHPSGRYLLAGNYSTGNYVVYRLEEDGSIGAKTADVQGEGNGTGPNADRQEGPHAHQILTDLDAQHVFGVDLGADRVNVWNLDLTSGVLTPSTVPFAPVASGSGPRHMAFHPDRKHAYVLNELVSSIDSFAYDPVRGAFIWLQSVSTLPRGFAGDNSTAEVRIHPDGDFLYATNRGHNSIAIFAIDSNTGELEPVGWESSRGEWPRGMNVDPTGTFVYVANQNTDTIAVFRILRPDGELEPAGLIHTPTPVDIEFGPLADSGG